LGHDGLQEESTSIAFSTTNGSARKRILSCPQPHGAGISLSTRKDIPEGGRDRFRKIPEATIPSVVRELFADTTRYFLYPQLMPDQAALLTFRDKSAAQVMALFKKHSYFHHPKNLSYSALLSFCCVNLVLLAVLAKMRKEKVAAVYSYAAVLALVALFMMLANCFLAVFQPRFTLPMWEVTIISASVLFGKTMECLFSPHRSLFSRHFQDSLENSGKANPDQVSGEGAKHIDHVART